MMAGIKYILASDASEPVCEGPGVSGTWCSDEATCIVDVTESKALRLDVLHPCLARKCLYKLPRVGYNF